MAGESAFFHHRRRSGKLRWLLFLALVPFLWHVYPRQKPVEMPAIPRAVYEVQYAPRPVPPPPALSATSAILMDADTGTILYQKNSHAQLPMASTTKIMTAYLLLQNAALNETVTASRDCEKVPPSSLYLKPGEQISVRDLVSAMLLRSANDTCVAAAEYVSGSEAAFVALMNAQARALGLKNTHYANPHGLNAPGHYSSAYDLARLSRLAMQNPVFAETVATKRKRIFRSKNDKDVVVVNKNRLLFRWDLVDGVKTGYTRQAGHCLVASASKNGWRLMAVVLRSGNSWDECRTLLEYGFRQYDHVVVAKRDSLLAPVGVLNGRKKSTQVMEASDVAMIVPRGTKLSIRRQVIPGRVRAPVRKGEPLGALEVRHGDKVVGRSTLLAVNAVEAPLRIPIWGVLLAALGTIVGVMILTAGAWYGRQTTQNTRRRRRRLSA